MNGTKGHEKLAPIQKMGDRLLASLAPFERSTSQSFASENNLIHK